MIRYFMAGGPFMFPLVLLAVVIAVIGLINVVRLFGQRSAADSVRASINGILFWGVVAAVLGFLGQWSGYWKASQVILRDGPRVGINPAAVIMGFGEALITAFVGLAVLIVACVLWYLLLARWTALARRQLSS